MIDLTNIAISVLTIIFGLISIYVIPYLKEKYTKEQLEKACAWSKIAVGAAEQLAKAGVIDPEDRKYYAMKVLESKNIKLDLDQLSDIVESYVLELPTLLTSESEEVETNIEAKPENEAK